MIDDVDASLGADTPHRGHGLRVHECHAPNRLARQFIEGRQGEVVSVESKEGAQIAVQAAGQDGPHLRVEQPGAQEGADGVKIRLFVRQDEVHRPRDCTLTAVFRIVVDGQRSQRPTRVGPNRTTST